MRRLQGLLFLCLVLLVAGRAGAADADYATALGRTLSKYGQASAVPAASVKWLSRKYSVSAEEVRRDLQGQGGAGLGYESDSPVGLDAARAKLEALRAAKKERAAARELRAKERATEEKRRAEAAKAAAASSRDRKRALKEKIKAARARGRDRARKTPMGSGGAKKPAPKEELPELPKDYAMALDKALGKYGAAADIPEASIGWLGRKYNRDTEQVRRDVVIRGGEEPAGESAEPAIEVKPVKLPAVSADLPMDYAMALDKAIGKYGSAAKIPTASIEWLGRKYTRTTGQVRQDVAGREGVEFDEFAEDDPRPRAVPPPSATSNEPEAATEPAAVPAPPRPPTRAELRRAAAEKRRAEREALREENRRLRRVRDLRMKEEIEYSRLQKLRKAEEVELEMLRIQIDEEELRQERIASRNRNAGHRRRTARATMKARRMGGQWGEHKEQIAKHREAEKQRRIARRAYLARNPPPKPKPLTRAEYLHLKRTGKDPRRSRSVAPPPPPPPPPQPDRVARARPITPTRRTPPPQLVPRPVTRRTQATPTRLTSVRAPAPRRPAARPSPPRAPAPKAPASTGNYTRDLDRLLETYGTVGRTPYQPIEDLGKRFSKSAQVVLSDMMKRSRQLRGE